MPRIINTTRLLLAAISLSTLAACASSPDAVRESASGKVEFQIEQPLALVYEQIAARASQCNPGIVRDDWPGSPFSALPGLETQWIVRTELAKDEKTARIQFLSKRHGIESHYMVTDFTADGLKTKVSTSYRFSAWERAAMNVKGWVTGGSQSCWLRG